VVGGADVVLFVESPPVEGVTTLARRRGVRVVCVPNWEWLHPGLSWLRDVDLMLCPTAYTRRLLDGWRTRFHFDWTVRLCRWPIDVSSFAFRARSVCRRYVTINGRPAIGRRKGLDLLLEAARRLPRIPFLIRSQSEDLPPMPPNVEVRPAAASNRELYSEGDVCVQLSRWEGLGLPLLECQAAGLPLITTDAPPMNEHNPLAVVPAADVELVELWHGRFAAVPRMRVDDVEEVLGSWHGRDISRASLAARAFVERDHSWPGARPMILEWLKDLR
jgi:glycosyltransferase involved in cell wall biosynthesis